MAGSAIDLATIVEVTENFEAYCAICLKVKNKKGDLVPFVWNRAQKHIHALLENSEGKRDTFGRFC